MNGEDHPHTSGDVDDCYKEFERAYNNSEIDKYAHETLVHEVFKKEVLGVRSLFMFLMKEKLHKKSIKRIAL